MKSRSVTKGRESGISSAIMNMTRGYFHSKIELKELPKRHFFEKEITKTKR